MGAIAVLTLVGVFAADLWVRAHAVKDRAIINDLQKTAAQTVQARDRILAMRELKDADMAKFKSGFTDLALSQKTVYESGLSLQEERRSLEKQLEIMTTYLVINPDLQRVFLMRNGQPLQGFLISYIPPRAFGGVSDTLPRTVRIVSKERFAHPERGHSEEVNGRLQWAPPQVGTSVRSNALGEYVMFTNSKLIIHGPPLNAEDHEKYPHICLGLDLAAAKKLYRGAFIGTKIVTTVSENQ